MLREILLSMAVIAIVSGCGSSSDSESSNDNLVTLRSSVLTTSDVCSNGGTEIFTGRDTNGNGVLDQGEETNSEIICNESENIKTLVDTKNLATNDEHCSSGGLEVLVGSDVNQDNILEPTEVKSTNYICAQTLESRSSIVLKEDTITIPTDQNMTVTPFSDENVSGMLFSAGATQNIAGAVFVEPYNDPYVDNANDIIYKAENLLQWGKDENDNSLTSSVHLVSHMNFPSSLAVPSSVMSYYDVTLTNPTKPVDFINEIFSLLFPATDDTTPLKISLSASDDSVAASIYRVGFSVQYIDATHIVMRIVVMDEENNTLYSNVADDILNPSTLHRTVQAIENGHDTFKAHAATPVSNKVDFLFVVDDSGGMHLYDRVPSRVADDFANAIQDTDLDYQIGIITGSSSYLIGGDFVDNNLTDFTERVSTIGTDASNSGCIYQAEKSLLTTADGADYNGSVARSGHPRPDAHLNIVIIANYGSNYSYYAGKDFDIDHNIFVDRNYTVYTIVNDESEEVGDSQYSDLTQVTDGLEFGLNNSTYTDFMKRVVDESKGFNNWYQLSHRGVIRNVTVNGIAVAESSVNGWTYHPASHRIFFHGDALPQVDATIEVDYEYARDLAVTSFTLSTDTNATYHVDDIIKLQANAIYENNLSAPLAINVDDMNITSSDTNVVAFVYGRLEAKNVGTADITVTLENGVQSTLPITVEE